MTHILPLLPSGGWRTKVYDMMHKAERIIDDRYSPSDRRCGGHITIAVDGLSGDGLREAVRKNSGIIYALFRNRLKNHYCSHNNRMQSYQECNDWHSKYQVALVKGDCLEFRVPSRFESVKQMMRRYELFYEVVNASVSGTSHEALLKRLKPVIVSMYNGDTDKANEVLSLAKHFRAYILKGDIHQDIAQYLG